MGFRSGDRKVVLGAGGYITKPRGELHTTWNAGKVPTRMIEIIKPAKFEHFFRGLANRGEVSGPLRHRVPGGTVAAGIIARYGLTPPMD